MRTDRLTVQVIKVSASTPVKVRPSAPREIHITSLGILVLTEILLTISTSLNRKVELELIIVCNISNSVELITEEAVAIKTKDNAMCIAVSGLDEQDARSHRGLIAVMATLCSVNGLPRGEFWRREEARWVLIAWARRWGWTWLLLARWW